MKKIINIVLITTLCLGVFKACLMTMDTPYFVLNGTFVNPRQTPVKYSMYRITSNYPEFWFKKVGYNWFEFIFEDEGKYVVRFENEEKKVQYLFIDTDRRGIKEVNINFDKTIIL